jgi:uncharacterized membrane protein SpoIIM required for sporulation
MSPLQFEALHEAEWKRLADALAQLAGERPFRRRRAKADQPDAAEPVSATEMSALYRRTCEHLALARARAYPYPLLQRLERLTADAHQALYRRHDYGLARLRRLLLVDFPQAVRAHGRELWLSLALFAVPALLVGWACWRDPGFVLTVLDAADARRFEHMYDAGNEAIGRERGADTDWQMFGHYVMNNIGVAFRCFAGGLLAGVGSLLFVGFNGVLLGAVAGFLTARGHGLTFYSFVVGHGAFELTAIVIAGAAGLRLGRALWAPGRMTRLQALQAAAQEAVVLVYGVAAMLLVAAFLEAFWSSAAWVTPQVKLGVGALLWALVLAYLGWQGRGVVKAGDAG